VAAADAIAARAFPQGAPGGVALIGKDGRAVFRRAYGLADLEFSIMLEPDMVFRIGSLTEQFTAAAVLLLAERGALDLNADIRQYVPQLQTGERRVTVAHLLAHTSGLPEITSRPAWRTLPPADVSPARVAELLSGAPFDAEPGASWRPATSEYLLLAYAIQRASGRPYGEFMREHVFLPLGLTQTVADDPRQVIPRRVHGYVRDGTEYRNAPEANLPDGARALVSTVDDLLRWDTGLTRGRLLRPEWLARMFEPAPLASDESSRFGFGWSLTTYEGHHVAERSGDTAGFSSHVVRVPDANVYVAVLSNRDGRPEVAARMLAALALGQPIAEPAAMTLAAATLDSFVGRYRNGSDEVVVARDGDGLVIRQNGDAVPLHAASGSEFFEPGGTLRVTFGAAADGKGELIEGGWGEPVTFVKAADAAAR
jgi:CubicO group peptidase (beta-lactamase class C family)